MFLYRKELQINYFLFSACLREAVKFIWNIVLAIAPTPSFFTGTSQNYQGP